MAKKVNNTAPWTEFAGEFSKRGWAPRDRSQKSLSMQRHYACGVEHTLLLNEMRPGELPGHDWVGVACAVNISFGPLEALRAHALRQDPASSSTLSIRLPLSQLAPAAHRIVGVYPIRRQANNLAELVAPLLADYDRYLEPLRLQLTDMSALRDETAVATCTGEWAWHELRALYAHLYSDVAVRKKVLVGLESLANEILGCPTADDASVPRTFNDIDELENAYHVRSAIRAKELTAALRALC